jgi:hypothetical protein
MMKIGRIYMIESPGTEKVYIGSTTRALTQRMAEHRNKKRCHERGEYGFCTSFDVLAGGDAAIRELEHLIIQTEADLLQLKRLERQYIEEHRNRATNKIIMNVDKPVCICECGGCWTSASSRSIHRRSRRHVEFMKRQNQNQNPE